ncbi:hypothetical protein [Bradyrhizobium sp. ARR65]|uniref:hypothetical protein n=1 Tax=Bradyrhizobium sp. ARR65 TaxID=1040989 RepID=UPI000464B1BB|nr:hypothetical protein [Bradyrhizobium sp. ARR65]
MPKTRFTEADVRRAIKGVMASGATIATVEIWSDGRISVTLKEDNGKTRAQMDPEDDPEVTRRLL